MLSVFQAAALLTLFGFTTAQESGWQDGQVNATMCQWVQPRTGVIRDTLYIDGGHLWWRPGFSNGTYGAPTQDDNPLGLVYTLNFSQPFNTSMNLSTIFGTISKAPNGGAANNFAPNYYDGAMFANDGEWYTYGGVLPETDQISPPDGNAVLGYEAYWYGASGKSFKPGFIQGKTPDGLTRYVTAGASVSVPSENLAFYFGGLRATNHGPIYGSPASYNESINANTLSDSFITFDMAAQEKEVWTNRTLPTQVPGRVNAELVWVPQGKRGVLVAIGGVVDPVSQNANMTLTTAQSTESVAQSLNFMTTVAVYDIETEQWYMQPTNSGSPPALTQGCTVVASSSDYTSHNIYWYGGFDGINPSKTFSDDVWILSLPSFMWMRVLQGTNGHGRAGHKCIKPYPDQMMVIGGYTPSTTTGLTCVDGGVVQVFNLSSAEWMPSYNPAVWSNVTVPGMIYNMIGGTGLGGANMLPPSWVNQSLSTLFSQPYNTSKLTNWYPYASQSVVLKTVGSSGGMPSWVAPVVGVIGALIVISGIFGCWLMYKRKQYNKAQGAADARSDENRSKVLAWIRGPPDVEKSATISSDDTKSPFDDVEHHAAAPIIPVEAADTPVFEMPDSSIMSEMGDTGMTYIPAAPLPSGRPNGLRSHPSNASRVSKLSHASTVTPTNSPSARDRTVSPLTANSSTPRPDSPSLGNSPPVPSPPTTKRTLSNPPNFSSPFRVRTSGLPDPFTSDEDKSPESPTRPTTERKRSTAGPGNYISGPVSPPTPIRNEETRDWLAAGNGSEPSLSGTPSRKAQLVLGIPPSSASSSKSRRKSVFGEMLDED